MQLTRFALVLVAMLSSLTVTLPVGAQQVADPNFDTKVARPAYAKGNSPKVLFDEAHHNFHTTTGRYQPFAALIGNDGYQVIANSQKFSSQTLAGHQVLVIANALGAAQMNDPAAASPAFTLAECQAVRDWVRAGGALLLIADHAPMGSAAELLGQQFGVNMSKGHTADPANYYKESGNQGFIKFERAADALGDHAITRGRTEAERLNHIQSFTGQSLQGPAESVALLKLASTAVDIEPKTKVKTSAAGRVQGLALKFGKGRVVVMGEAAMFSAQLAGPEKMAFGMNQPGLDNRQLVLNTLHWLTGLLN